MKSKLFFISYFLLVGFIYNRLFLSVAYAASWYVDNVATGANNGTSWTNAWQSIADIGWIQIQPGDTIYISGGSTSKQYNECLYISKRFECTCPDGTADDYITVQVGQEEGHNGIVEITGDENVAVRFNHMSYYTLSGQVGSSSGRHIRIRNRNTSGIIQEYSHHINYRYLEILESGEDLPQDQEAFGIDITFQAGSDVSGEIAYCDIHDVRQDNIQLITLNAEKAIGYGMYKIHHNLIRNIHDDGISGSMGGVDIYKNEIGPRILPHRGHPDGIQVYNSYYRIYNNYFHDWYIDGAGPESNGDLTFLYWEPNGGGQENLRVNEGHPSNLMIYNNIFYEPEQFPEGTNNNRGISLGISDVTFSIVSDIFICNNYFEGDMDCIGISFDDVTLFNKEDVFSFFVFNNVLWNVGRNQYANLACTFTTPNTRGGSAVNYGAFNSGASIEVDYNIYSGDGASWVGGADSNGVLWNTYASFKNRTGAQAHDFGSPNISTIGLDTNFRPLEGSIVIDTGLDLNLHFHEDKDGNNRPQGKGWDLGPYEFISANSLVPSTSLEVPVRLQISPNYPNPFNSGTIIQYNIPEDSRVVIMVYDILGRKARTLRDEWQKADWYTVSWDGKNSNGVGVSSGVYMIYMKGDYFQKSQKVLLLK